MRFTREAAAFQSLKYAKPASAEPRPTLAMMLLTFGSRLTVFDVRIDESCMRRRSWRVYAPIGTPAVPTARRRPPLRRPYTECRRAGLPRGVTSTRTFVANVTGREHLPARNSACGSAGPADANRSAGAPRSIWSWSWLEPAKLYFGEPSIRGNAALSDAAPYTVNACAAAGAARTRAAAMSSAAGVRRKRWVRTVRGLFMSWESSGASHRRWRSPCENLRTVGARRYHARLVSSATAPMDR